jgi:hypothetical protein
LQPPPQPSPLLAALPEEQAVASYRRYVRILRARAPVERRALMTLHRNIIISPCPHSIARRLYQAAIKSPLYPHIWNKRRDLGKRIRICSLLTAYRGYT